MWSLNVFINDFHLPCRRVKISLVKILNSDLLFMLQASFAYNNCYCAKAKPAENLPSSNPVKQIQKNHVQSKPIIQSADFEIMSLNNDKAITKFM